MNNASGLQDNIEEKNNRYYRTNFMANVGDGAFFAAGNGFISRQTILPLFLSNLTDSKLLISLIVTIFMFGSTVPQLISARWAESLKKKKKTVLIIAFFHRLPFLVLTLLIYVLTPNYLDLLLISFFVCWLFYSLATGTIMPVWFDLITKIIPVKKRGMFFGYRSFISNIFGVAAAFNAGLIIKQFVYPESFLILFGLTSAAVVISFIFMLFIKETDKAETRHNVGFIEYFKLLPRIIKKQKNFRNYLISIFFIQFIGMVNGLFTVAGIETLGLDTKAASNIVGNFTILMILSQSIGAIFWGHLSDRIGHKLVLVFSGIFNLIGVVIAITANSPLPFYLVFICTGLALGGEQVSFMTITPEFCRPEERPTYVALTNTMKGLTVVMISVLGGLLVDLFSYQFVFIIACLMITIGVYFLTFKVKEPRFHTDE